MIAYALYSAAALVCVAAVLLRYRRDKMVRDTIGRAEVLLCVTDQGRVAADSSGERPRHDCGWFVRLGKDDSGFMYRYCARCRMLVDLPDGVPDNLVILGNYRGRVKKKMRASEVYDSTPPTAA